MTLQQLRSLGLVAGDRVKVICQTSDTKCTFLKGTCPTSKRSGYYIDNESVIRKIRYEQTGVVAGTEESIVENPRKQGEMIALSFLEIGKRGDRLSVTDRKINRDEEGWPLRREGVCTMRIPVSAIVDVIVLS